MIKMPKDEIVLMRLNTRNCSTTKAGEQQNSLHVSHHETRLETTTTTVISAATTTNDEYHNNSNNNVMQIEVNYLIYWQRYDITYQHRCSYATQRLSAVIGARNTGNRRRDICCMFISGCNRQIVCAKEIRVRVIGLVHGALVVAVAYRPSFNNFYLFIYFVGKYIWNKQSKWHYSWTERYMTLTPAQHYNAVDFLCLNADSGQ